MHLILCIDDRGGMLFNRRRQSQDREVRRDMLSMADGHALWMNAYSAGQFSEEERPRLHVAEDFLDRAGEEDFCFVEDRPADLWPDRAKCLVLYRWNRVYPSDLKLDLASALEGWTLLDSRDFPGYSHETITKEVYAR